jgi:hypothetical protein
VAQRPAISPVRCSRSARRWTAAQRVGGVRATEYDQLGSERAEPLDLLHELDGLDRVESAQRRPVKQPVESCPGDRSQVLTLAAGQIQVEPGQDMRRGERAVLAVAGDQLCAQPGGLHDAHPLRTRAVSPAWVTSASARRQSPSTQNTVRSPGPADSAASAAGVKPSQNCRLVSSDHGPRTSNSATRPAIACSVRFADTRTVADGTDTAWPHLRKVEADPAAQGVHGCDRVSRMRPWE